MAIGILRKLRDELRALGGMAERDPRLVARCLALGLGTAASVAWGLRLGGMTELEAAQAFGIGGAGLVLVLVGVEAEARLRRA